MQRGISWAISVNETLIFFFFFARRSGHVFPVGTPKHCSLMHKFWGGGDILCLGVDGSPPPPLLYETLVLCMSSAAEVLLTWSKHPPPFAMFQSCFTVHYNKASCDPLFTKGLPSWTPLWHSQVTQLHLPRLYQPEWLLKQSGKNVWSETADCSSCSAFWPLTLVLPLVVRWALIGVLLLLLC